MRKLQVDVPAAGEALLAGVGYALGAGAGAALAVSVAALAIAALRTGH